MSKENIFINVTLDLFFNLIETLYFDLVLSNRHIPNYLPIIITDNISLDSENYLQQKMLSKGSFENNELTIMGLGHVVARMALLDDLSLEFPFLILGVDREQDNFYVHSFESKHKSSTNRERFNQCITFLPEYYQAGLSILNYFGTVLRNKYPEQKATVKIEQHENMVRMIVESENGDKDIIEKALYEYELVMSGKMPLEEFYQEQAQVLELKQHIRILEVQLENQRDLLRWQDRSYQETQNRILDLQEVVRGLLNQNKAPITVNNYLTNQQTVNINHKNELNHSYDLLDELIDAVKDESLKNQLRDLQNALDQSKNLEQAAQVKDSSGFKKLSKFIKQANDTSSDVHGILDKTDKAIGLMAKLNEHYANLVQFTSGLI